MAKHNSSQSGVLLDEEMRLSLAELCQMLDLDAEQIINMVQEGIIEPIGHHPEKWHFSGNGVKRVQIAIRLQRDLRVNLPGVALALDLLDELEELRRQSGHH